MSALDYATLTPGWHRDGEIMREDGPYPPDTLATEPWSVRFVKHNPDGTWTFVTMYVAGVYAGDACRAAGIVDVQQITEILTCSDPTDPGGSEITGTYEYEYRNDLSRTIGQADDDARAIVAALTADDLGSAE